MKTLGDVVAEPVKEDDTLCPNDDCLVRRGSLDSVDRISLTSTSTSSVGSEIGTRTLKSLKRGINKLWRRHRGNASITDYDPIYKVAYLGNVLTGWAKGEGCVEKPVSTLWRNYVSSNRPDVSMRLTVTNGGLTATTKDHGLTEYWAHRVTYCTAPASHPRLFVWVYRHEGRRLRPELRCHAAICSKESTARRLAQILNARLHQALLEFRRDKVSRQNARLSLANAVYENPSLPRRKLLLSTGGANYRPPLERSKSAPKLSAIEEDAVAEEIEQQRFLDELRNFERESCGWEEQEGWRLAKLLEALQQQHESSDENGSISSGCETASTANSEERVSSSEDSHIPIEQDLISGQRTSGNALTAAMTPQQNGPRRNSEGSPNFMTCTGSPRFRRRNCRSTRTRSRSTFTLLRNECEEDEDEESSTPTTAGTTTSNDNFFDFEDPEDLDEIVDFRPHGESRSPQSPSRLQNDSYAALIARRDDVLKMMSSRLGCQSFEELDSPTDKVPVNTPNLTQTSNQTAVPNVPTATMNLHKLTSLDEEEVDSDESGYVEASPKSSMDRTSLPPEKPQETNNNEPINDDEPAEFIKCPISETIKKLANASLRSSKGVRVSPTKTYCSESLNRVNRTDVEDLEPTPSLLQRKRLLAQRGVTV